MVNFLNFPNILLCLMNLFYQLDLDKRYKSVVKNQQKRENRIYKETVLDKKLESLERISNRKLERKIVSFFLTLAPIQVTAVLRQEARLDRCQGHTRK